MNDQCQSCAKGRHSLFWSSIVYPKKYAHGFVVLCFVVVMQSFIMNSHEVFIHIHQGCFAGTGAIVRLPQCQWSKPDGYGKISQCITTTKHSKAKTVCIFPGIYCMYDGVLVCVRVMLFIFMWYSMNWLIFGKCTRERHIFDSAYHSRFSFNSGFITTNLGSSPDAEKAGTWRKCLLTLRQLILWGCQCGIGPI